MARSEQDQRRGPPDEARQAAVGSRRRRVIGMAAAGAAVGIIVLALAPSRTSQRLPAPNRASSNSVSTPAAAFLPALETLEIAQAVMVTVDLNFGSSPPPIAEALRQVERRYEPEDGVGRTFSIIEAFGEPTPEGKLRMSMHVSTEKTGTGALIFRRTGEVLWQSRVLSGTNSATVNSFNPGNLTVLLDNLQGKTWMVDGSGNPSSLLTAKLRNSPALVQSVWPDGAEMEVSFIYSACGCPVKVRARRVGDRTVRTKELPVIFPDDPAVVRLIEKLMGWA